MPSSMIDSASTCGTESFVSEPLVDQKTPLPPQHEIHRDRDVDRESITLASQLHSFDDDSPSAVDSNTFRTMALSTKESLFTRAISPATRSSNNLGEFTVNRLNFRFRSLFGRDREIQLLNKSLQQANRLKQLIIIRGYSGVGKTALAETLRKPTTRAGGVFARGKFDLNQRNKPYQGIATACEDICSRLAALRYEDFERYRMGCEKIRLTLGRELGLMEKVVPLLADLMDLHSSTERALEDSMDRGGSQEAKNRFIYAFQRLITAFSETFQPLVISIDDLQWADAASLDLLQSIVAHESISNLVLLGIYRSNEVSDSHILSKMIRECRPMAVENRFSMVEIHIGCLDVSSVHSLIQDVLGSTEAKTLNLADLCHRKTNGNVFFLLHYLMLLNERSLLTFNFGSLRWEWDEADIELRTNATENVVDLLQSKMKDLKPNDKKALELAACFGNAFSLDTFSIAWEEIYGASQQTNDIAQRIQSIIDSLVGLGYLERIKEKELKFTHDKIQEASSSLAPASERHELCRRVGTILVSKLPTGELESSISLVVDLLNEGEPPQDEAKRIELADLNRQACHASMSIAAFDASAGYAAFGIGLLGENKWEEHYDLTLDLYSLGAEAEGLLGNIKTMEVYYNEVIAQEQKPVQDKLRVYNSYCSSVAGQGNPRAAAELAMRVLRKLNIHFPRSKGAFLCQLVQHFFWVKKMVKTGKLDALESLQVDNDPLRLNIAKFLDKLSLFFYLCGDELFLIVNFMAMRRTFEYGLNEHSSMGISGVGMAMAALGEYQAAAILGRFAVHLSGHSLPLLQCRALLCGYGFCLHFTEPLRQSAKPLVRAYDLGLRAGGTDSACYAILTYAKVSLITSRHFKMMASDLKIYSRQAKDLTQEFPSRFLLLYLEYCENMLGESDTDRLLLYGTRVTCEEVEQWKKADTTFHQLWVILQGMLYTIYGAHDKGATLALQEGTEALMKTFPGSPLAYYDILGKGLSCFAMARETKSRKFLRVANTMHKRVKKWATKGNPNANHFDALFEAELAAFRGKTFAAISKYETAVLLSARSGLLVDAALCSERFAEFLLQQQDREDDAKFRFEQAIAFYKEVGAFRKADSLSQEQAALWPPPSGILAITEK